MNYFITEGRRYAAKILTYHRISSAALCVNLCGSPR